MKKWVILEFGQGSFKTGFPVTVRIGTDGIEGSTRIPDGFLPPAPSSLTEITLEEWRQRFEEWINFFANRAIKVKPQVNTVGINFQDQTQNLISDVKSWLNSKDEKWDRIIKDLSIQLNQTDEIRIIVQTDNPNLRRLPWQVWDLFIEHFPKTEFAFSPSQQKVVGVTASPQKSEKVRILVILGEPLEKGQEKKINYQSDIDAINKLGANAEFLLQPTRQELINKLWENPWQIIFYSGHSSSEIDGSKGYLQLRKNEIITIDDLKESLRESITKGLQLAIFNSCQGLGIAKQLEDLALPQVIVMREKVPDVVAQMFLQDFLTAFAGGDGERYLHDALREARKKLRDKWEDKYPGISWLPVICQQCADSKSLIWNKLLLKDKENHTSEWKCISSFSSDKDSNGYVYHASISPIDDTIILTTPGSNLKIWELQQDKQNIFHPLLINTIQTNVSGIYDVVFSRNGKTIAVCGMDTKIEVWDLHNSQLMKTLGKSRFEILGDDTDTILDIFSNFLPISKDFIYKKASQINISGHSDDIFSIRFSPDEKFLASCSLDKTIKIWDLDSGKLIRTLCSDIPIGRIAMNRDGETLASDYNNNQIAIWNLKTGEIKRTLFGYDGGIRSLAFSHDGNLLASGSWSGGIIDIWNWKTGQLIYSLSSGCQRINCLSFSPNDQLLASGCSDKTIKLWNPSDGKLIQTFDTPTPDEDFYVINHAGITSVGFSADGKRIVSCNKHSPQEIKVWQIDEIAT